MYFYLAQRSKGCGLGKPGSNSLYLKTGRDVLEADGQIAVTLIYKLTALAAAMPSKIKFIPSKSATQNQSNFIYAKFRVYWAPRREITKFISRLLKSF